MVIKYTMFIEMTHFRIQFQKRFYAHLTDLVLGNVDVTFGVIRDSFDLKCLNDERTTNFQRMFRSTLFIFISLNYFW